jgi:hypothetical protein
VLIIIIVYNFALRHCRFSITRYKSLITTLCLVSGDLLHPPISTFTMGTCRLTNISISCMKKRETGRQELILYYNALVYVTCVGHNYTDNCHSFLMLLLHPNAMPNATQEIHLVSLFLVAAVDNEPSSSWPPSLC